MIQQEVLAYIGGLMDGDGSFTLGRRTNPKGVSLLFYPLIQFGSLSKEPLEEMKRYFGGTISFSKSHTKKDGSLRRDFYRWRIEKSAKCSKFLEDLIPYLEIKKERAEFLKDFILRNPFKRGSNRLSEEVTTSRENDYTKMKEFNDERTFSRKMIKQSKTISSDKLFWPYFAGLLDTDGSFSIKKEKNEKYSSQILLTMTDIRGMNKIRKNTPFGTVFLVKAKTTTLGRCYRLGIYRKEELLVLLPLVIPFLRNKKNQAEELLNFCKNVKTVMLRKEGVPKDELNFRESCYKKIIMLNKYGVYKPSLIDLEAQAGDRAEGESHGERLNEVDASDSICESLTTANI